MNKDNFVPMAQAMRDFRVEYTRLALQATGGKKAEAARLLGVSRKWVWEVMKGATPEEQINSKQGR